MMQEESADANELQGANITAKNQTSIEDALKFVDQISEDQFINEANNMVFKVSQSTFLPFISARSNMVSLIDGRL